MINLVTNLRHKKNASPPPKSRRQMSINLHQYPLRDRNEKKLVALGGMEVRLSRVPVVLLGIQAWVIAPLRGHV